MVFSLCFTGVCAARLCWVGALAAASRYTSSEKLENISSNYGDQSLAIQTLKGLTVISVFLSLSCNVQIWPIRKVKFILVNHNGHNVLLYCMLTVTIRNSTLGEGVQKSQTTTLWMSTFKSEPRPPPIPATSASAVRARFLCQAWTRRRTSSASAAETTTQGP